jgi:hypothetical protein
MHFFKQGSTHHECVLLTLLLFTAKMNKLKKEQKQAALVYNKTYVIGPKIDALFSQKKKIQILDESN